MTIPFIDFARLSHTDASVKKAIDEVLRQRWYIRGPEVDDFEAAFARALGTGYCIATGNGTDSLYLALRALGIGPGDEVITPAFGWISSAETVSLCGATPVFADVNESNFCLDPQRLREKITHRTRAVVVVHLYGGPADIQPILELCQSHDLALVEDCAQAHLTRYNNRTAGTFGQVGCFSFYPTKNLGALGDAGCVVTNNAGLNEKIRRLANHGALEKDDHLIEGTNSRMDTLQAAVLLARLPHLESWNHQRRQNAALYAEGLKDIHGIVPPSVADKTEHTFHLFVIRARERDALKSHLEDHGIQTMIHYPKALPNLPAYRRLGHHPSDFPVASRFEGEVLSLPIFPGLTPDEVSYICDRIREFYANR